MEHGGGGTRERRVSAQALDDVLVVTVRKSFWASPEAEAFPHRIYARVYYGHSSNLLNAVVVTLRGLVAALLRRRRVVLLGSVERAVPWFIAARRLGLLRGAKLVVTNQLHLSDVQLEQVERVILYARPVIEAARPALRERAVFAYLPADGDFAAARRSAVETDAVFAGGGADRDFAALIEAVRATGVPLEIVTFSRESLGFQGELPEEVTVHWRMPLPAFLARMAGARLVVVPLRDPSSPHGQTTVVQALALGKAVVATRCPSVTDYVEDGREGTLVEAGDVAALREAILGLWRDDELRAACTRAAAERAEDLTYACLRRTLEGVCDDLVSHAR
jgi:glycosyltransferase involved in cell wall biosynthesis